MKRAVKKSISYLPSHSSHGLPESIPPNEFVALYAVIVLLPDIFVFPAPAAHQIRAHENVALTFVACDIMTSANVEQPGPMAKAAFDIGETIANRKVAHGCHAHFSLSRSMITPFLMKMMCLRCSFVKSSGKNIASLTGTAADCFLFAIFTTPRIMPTSYSSFYCLSLRTQSRLSFAYSAFFLLPKPLFASTIS
jgi:hypothetical protein